MEVATWRVIEVQKESLALSNRGWVRYFEVEKNQKLRLTRAILDCRQVNQLCGKPPVLELADLEWIFHCVALFSHPCFATLDFTHFFFQISLPTAVRRLFTVKCAGAA